MVVKAGKVIERSDEDIQVTVDPLYPVGEAWVCFRE